MDVDQIIVKSLDYPRQSWGKVATLGAILIVPFLVFALLVFLGAITNNAAVIAVMSILGIILVIIAGIIFYGYFYRTTKATIAGFEELPNFDEWGEMTLDGLKVLVVNIIYGIIFGIISAIPIGIVMLILGFFGILSSAATTFADPTAALGAGLVLWVVYLAMFILYLIVLVIGVLYLIVVPIGIANMAYKEDFGSAFDFSEIRNKIDDIRWSKAIIWVIANYFVFTVAIMISYILGLLLIGIILVPLLVIPFLALYYARSIGLIYLNG